MAATFDLENERPLSGDSLRDEVANLFSYRYGRPIREFREGGKKADLYFEREEFGKAVRYYVEVKDLASPIGRGEVNRIWSDYEGIMRLHEPAVLILVTRNGLTADSQSYVRREKHNMRHQTIWEVAHSVVPLTDYVRSLSSLFDEDGLSSYYVPSRGYDALARAANVLEQFPLQADAGSPLFDMVMGWLASDDMSPVAILGGYGMGKTSFARMIVTHQAHLALVDPTARRPILVKLGALTRYSSLEGLLGGMFTYDYPIEGFNVRTLLALNTSGRFFFVLDGFDEMKHAMTWADFRAQIATLNGLIGGKAKVLLLGRPNAFLSEDEHFHILRGLKKYGGAYRRLPDWPEFREYQILEFDRDERASFVRDYLRHARSALRKSDTVEGADEIAFEARAEEVSKLAAMEPEIFNKPVHAKILVDLAADPSIDLSELRRGLTRWSLYETFFSTLTEREVTKDARRRISEHHRLAFLQELAFWLWTQRSAVTDFTAEEIPDELMAALPDGDADPDDLETKKREYLSGAVLEAKSSGVYFFGHRSFAEFLVARRMYQIAPRDTEQAQYSALLNGTVRSFLAEAPDQSRFQQWSKHLAQARGALSVEYLDWIAVQFQGRRNLSRTLLGDSPWRRTLEALGESEKGPDTIVPRALKLMRSRENLNFAIGCRVLAEVRTHDSPDLSAQIAAILLLRALSEAKASHAGQMTAGLAFADAIGLAAILVPNVAGIVRGESLDFNGQQLGAQVHRIFLDNEFGFSSKSEMRFRRHQVTAKNIIAHLPRGIVMKLEVMSRVTDPWDKIRLR